MQKQQNQNKTRERTWIKWNASQSTVKSNQAQERQREKARTSGDKKQPENENEWHAVEWARRGRWKVSYQDSKNR